MYGVLTLPVLHTKYFSVPQVGMGGSHYDRHLLVETCLGIADCILCPYVLVLYWWSYFSGRIETYTPWKTMLCCVRIARV